MWNSVIWGGIHEFACVHKGVVSGDGVGEEEFAYFPNGFIVSLNYKAMYYGVSTSEKNV